jgi:hypothetical protein
MGGLTVPCLTGRPRCAFPSHPTPFNPSSGHPSPIHCSWPWLPPPPHPIPSPEAQGRRNIGGIASSAERLVFAACKLQSFGLDVDVSSNVISYFLPNAIAWATSKSRTFWEAERLHGVQHFWGKNMSSKVQSLSSSIQSSSP